MIIKRFKHLVQKKEEQMSALDRLNVKEHNPIEMCPECRGVGKYWSDIGFGDGPADSKFKNCRRCQGSGRIFIAEAVCVVEFPMAIVKYDKTGNACIDIEEDKII